MRLGCVETMDGVIGLNRGLPVLLHTCHPCRIFRDCPAMAQIDVLSQSPGSRPKCPGILDMEFVCSIYYYTGDMTPLHRYSMRTKPNYTDIGLSASYILKH